MKSLLLALTRCGSTANPATRRERRTLEEPSIASGQKLLRNVLTLPLRRREGKSTRVPLLALSQEEIIHGSTRTPQCAGLEDRHFIYLSLKVLSGVKMSDRMTNRHTKSVFLFSPKALLLCVFIDKLRAIKKREFPQPKS